MNYFQKKFLEKEEEPMEISIAPGSSKFNPVGLYNPMFSGSFEGNRNEIERTPSLGSGESGSLDYDQSTSKLVKILKIEMVIYWKCVSTIFKGNLPVSYAIQKFENLNKKGTAPLVSTNGPTLGRSSTMNSGNTSPTNINRSNSNITTEVDYNNR